MKIISIKGTNVDLTPSIVDTIEKKLVGLSKFTEKMEPAAELTVEVGKSTKHHKKGPFWRTEAQLVLPGTVLRAECTDISLYGTIDLAKDDLSEQIKKYKERGKSRAMRGARIIKKLKSYDPDSLEIGETDLSERRFEEGD